MFHRLQGDLNINKHIIYVWALKSDDVVSRNFAWECTKRMNFGASTTSILNVLKAKLKPNIKVNKGEVLVT